MPKYITLTHYKDKPRIGAVSDTPPTKEELAAWYSAGRGLWVVCIPDDAKPILSRHHPSWDFDPQFLVEDDGGV